MTSSSPASEPEASTPARKAIPKRLRFEIMRRDNHACRYCGAAAPDAKLTVDHVVPVVLGGKDDPTNLVTACTDCNAGKSSSNPDAPLVADVITDALRFRQAVELAVTLAARDREMIDNRVTIVLESWTDRWRLGGFESVPVDPPNDARPVLGDFFARGLSWEDAIDMVDVTVAKYRRDRSFYTQSVWPYFLGCCRKKTEAVEAAAHRLMEEGQV